MKDSIGNIIYVGKAKNLKRRVQSYFQNTSSHSQKVVKLKNNIRDFDIILTDTEFEAFMLECSLIQEIKPFFNRKMKNPQAYTYITIQMDKKYPKIEVSSNPVLTDGNLLFGPYISKHTVEKALLGIKEFCKILCSSPSKRNTPCLNYSLGLCIGMCLGDSAVGQYQIVINRIITLLNGTDLSIFDEMKQKMIHASESFDFETAAKYRDYIDAISFLLNKERVIEFTEENKNLAMIEYVSDSTFKLFLIKGNKVLFSEKYMLGPNNLEKLKDLIKTNMIIHFNTKEMHSYLEVSKEDIDEAQIIYSYLKSGNCNYMMIPENWLVPDHADLDAALNQLLAKHKRSPPHCFKEVEA